MRIEVFEAQPAPDRPDAFVPDDTRRVAVVTVRDGNAELVVEDERRAHVLRQLFSESPVTMGAGDSVERPAAWSAEALHILRQELLAFNLAARVYEGDSSC